MTSSGEEQGVVPAAPAVHFRGGALLVGVRVIPSAARTEMRGVYGDRLKVAVNAPPEGGKANARLVEALADWLDVRTERRSRCNPATAARDKVVAFSGMRRTRIAGQVEQIAPRSGAEREEAVMDLEALKRALIAERERLGREIADLDADLSESLEDSSEESPYDQHMAETAAVTLDREIDLTLEENARAGYRADRPGAAETGRRPATVSATNAAAP